jgi:hypothetical protein
MMLAHANRLAEVPEDHWSFWLRLGAVTESFVMLTGLAVALIYDNPRRDLTNSSQRILRRAFKLAGVAYSSNVVLSLARESLHGNVTFDHFVEINLGLAPWTISSVLLGTTLTLLAMPFFLALAQAVQPRLLLLITFALGLAGTIVKDFAGQFAEATNWVTVLFVNGGVLGFPIGLLCGLGIWTFGLGIFFTRHKDHDFVWKALVVLSFLIYCRFDQWSGLSSFVPYWPRHFIATTSQFVLLLAIAMTFCRIPTAGIRSFAALLGRSSLLVFLAHRIVMQIHFLLLEEVLSGSALSLTCMIGTITICGSLCWARERFKALSLALESIGM